MNEAKKRSKIGTIDFIPEQLSLVGTLPQREDWNQVSWPEHFFCFFRSHHILALKKAGKQTDLH